LPEAAEPELSAAEFALEVPLLLLLPLLLLFSELLLLVESSVDPELLSVPPPLLQKSTYHCCRS
jgi:hypothetical protein